MAKIPRISYLLRQAQLANSQLLDKALRDFGVTPSQYMVLAIVEDHPEGLFSAALARRLGVAPQSSNEVVASLERLDLVRRVTETGPRRVLPMRLTAKGRALLARCDKAVDRFERDFFGGLSAAELATMRNLLGRLIRMHRQPQETENENEAEAKQRRRASG